MFIVKKLFVLSILIATCSATIALEEVGRVVSSTPIIQQVAIPTNVCVTEQVTKPSQKSGAGALMGAIAGGAMGNAIGGGNGKTAATVLGLFGGAIVGDRVEGAPSTQTQNVERCTVQTQYENRIVGFNVIYEYAGKQYSMQRLTDPGSTIRLSLNPL